MASDNELMGSNPAVPLLVAVVIVILLVSLMIVRPQPTWSAAGKRVLITGASAGIGKELALQMAAEGASLALLARREGLLAELADACKATGAPTAAPITCDVTDRARCKEAVALAANALGGRFDVVILNAGMSQGCYFEDIKDLSDADYLMNLNVMGCVNILHFALPSVAKANSSRIVLVSSIAGCVGVPFRTIYCASKWAVNGFAAALRLELEHGYGLEAPKVVVTCPPEVKSDLNTGRLAFGAGMPAESTPSAQMPTAPAVAIMLRGIAAADRYTHFKLLSKVLHMLYTILGAFLDPLILKMILKTTKTNGQGR